MGLALLRQTADQHQALAPGIEHEATQSVHHRQPGHAGKQGKPDQQQGEQQQAGAVGVEYCLARTADHAADNAARSLRQLGGGTKVQCRQRGGGQHDQDETDPARDTQIDAVSLVVALAEHQPAAPGDHQRKHVGDLAEHHEQHTRRPGAGDAAGVVRVTFGALEHPTGIVR